MTVLPIYIDIPCAAVSRARAWCTLYTLYTSVPLLYTPVSRARAAGVAFTPCLLQIVRHDQAGTALQPATAFSRDKSIWRGRALDTLFYQLGWAP